MERFDMQPIIVIDAAHNEASAKALAEALDVLCSPAPREQRVLLLAISEEKDAAGIARALAPNFLRIVATRYIENPRAMPPAKLAATLRAVAPKLEVTLSDHPTNAYAAATALAGIDGAVVVAGSFFLAAEVRRLVTQTPGIAPNV